MNNEIMANVLQAQALWWSVREEILMTRALAIVSVPMFVAALFYDAAREKREKRKVRWKFAVAWLITMIGYLWLSASTGHFQG